MHHSIKRFNSAVAGKVYKQMVAMIRSRSLELHYQNCNLSIQWKQTFYLSASIWTQLFIRKRLEHARFMDDNLKARSIKNV